MSQQREYYLPGFAFGLRGLRRAVRVAADEMQSAIREARFKNYVFPAEPKPVQRCVDGRWIWVSPDTGEEIPSSMPSSLK
jgi:hypothetical protein